jgi:small subunit ribosomal protein S3Ae
MGRTVEVSMQELTNDFSKSHIKLMFKIVETKGTEAHTVFAGHALTTDYVKRMSRKHKSKVDGVFDVVTRDGVPLRIKPEAMAGKRIQHSQKRAIRAIIKDTVDQAAQTHDFDEFIQFMLEGDMGKEAYRQSKTIYPIKRVEVYKSEILEIPKVKVVTEAREQEALATAAAADEAAASDTETVEEAEPDETKEAAVAEPEEEADAASAGPSTEESEAAAPTAEDAEPVEEAEVAEVSAEADAEQEPATAEEQEDGASEAATAQSDAEPIEDTEEPEEPNEAEKD